MTVGRVGVHSGSLGVGLGISVAVHLALIGGYGAFVANGKATTSGADEIAQVDFQTAVEIITLPREVGPAAPDAAVSSALAAVDVPAVLTSTPSSPPASKPIVVPANLTSDLSMRMAAVAAPIRSRETMIPQGAVTAQAAQVASSQEASGWYPGMYERPEEDLDRPFQLTRILGMGPHCPSGSRVTTSINRTDPYGGISR